MGINFGGFHIGMTHKFLNNADISAEIFGQIEKVSLV